MENYTNDSATEQAPNTALVSTAETHSRTRSKALIVLATIAVITVFYVAKLILLPILVAGFIALFASPLVRLMTNIFIPKPIASFCIVVGLVAAVTYLSTLLIDPALRWIEAAPVIGDRLMFEIQSVSEPVATASAIDEDTPINDAMNTTLMNLTSVFAHGTLIFLTQLAAIVIISYFFMVYGEDLMRNIVRAQNNFSDKKLTVVMFQSIRDDTSNYVLVVSLINIGLGLCTAGALTLIGFEDALLWGAMATMLNFAPYVGPLLLATILAAVGFAGGDPWSTILLAPGLFLVLNLIESQFVTPTVLGRRFNINPLLVVLWMFIWGWLWGAAGLLLAIPILMCFKLVTYHLNLLGNWSEIFNGVNHEEIGAKKPALFERFTKRSTNRAS